MLLTVHEIYKNNGKWFSKQCALFIKWYMHFAQLNFLCPLLTQIRMSLWEPLNVEAPYIDGEATQTLKK